MADQRDDRVNDEPALDALLDADDADDIDDDDVEPEVVDPADQLDGDQMPPNR